MKKILKLILIIFLSLIAKNSNAFVLFIGDDYSTAVNKIKTSYWPDKSFVETRLIMSNISVPAIIVTSPSEVMLFATIIFGIDNKCIVEDYTFQISYLSQELAVLNSLYKSSSTESNTWLDPDGKIKYTLKFNTGNNYSFEEIVTSVN